MSDPGGGSAVVWSTPECSFEILCDYQVLDDIRLAVVDAFFSLPRGGAEIGGILLGSHNARTVGIDSYAPLECEHAFGPAFTLSQNDHVRLADLVRTSTEAGREVVGWYHSHTRSDIFLSDADLEIHNRYFPDPWQVALVMKPFTFKPPQCGFFFREAGGRIRAGSSYREFALEAPQVKPAPARPQAGRTSARTIPNAAAAAAPVGASRRPVLTVEAVTQASARPPVPVQAVVAEPAPAARAATAEAPHERKESTVTAAPAPLDIPPPGFGQSSAPERSFAGLYWLLLACAVVAGGYQTRHLWMAPSTGAPAPDVAEAALKGPPPSKSTSAPAGPPPVRLPLSLALTDSAGQLQIRWDTAAALVQNSRRGTIEINDGNAKAVVPLDETRLRAGVFTYTRQTQAVDVRLTVEDDRGNSVREAASYLGKLPEKPAEDPEIVRQRDELARESARLKAELEAQAERTRKLERSVEEMRMQLKRDQQRRLANQSPDASR